MTGQWDQAFMGIMGDRVWDPSTSLGMTGSWGQAFMGRMAIDSIPMLEIGGPVLGDRVA